MNKHLITGGAGFIGSHLAEHIMKAGDEVHIIDNFSFGARENINFVEERCIHQVDILDYRQLKCTFDKISPTHVYHLAAIHFIPYCDANPRDAVMINNVGTQNVVDIVAGLETERLFFASTAAVYGPSNDPHQEEEPVQPMDIYGATKAAGERIVRILTQRTGKSVVVGRLFNAVGTRETNPHLLPEICKQIAGGKTTLSLGNITPKRDFVDARDMARAIFQATSETMNELATYNIGSAKQYSVSEVVAICEKLIGRPIDIYQDPSRVRKVERENLAADIRKISKDIGWKPEIPLEETLEELLSQNG